MDAHDLLRRLPDPDPAGQTRVWRRFEASRADERPAARWRRPALAGLGLALAAAAAAVVFLRDPHRTEVLGEDESLAWSEQVHLEPTGRGVANGTGRDLSIDWVSGALRVEVEPNTGTNLEVRAEEGSVRVVGTAFTVVRDELGLSTTVEHGRVKVSCDDGWSGEVTADSGPHTCLPTRPAALLGRARALGERGASPDAVLETLDRGLSLADAGSAVEGELLARRVAALGEAGRVGPALADADRYLASPHDTRRADVLRTAGRLAMAGEGCARALPYLEALGDGRAPDDHAMLASCLPGSERARALDLARRALNGPGAATPAWRRWAEDLLATEIP